MITDRGQLQRIVAHLEAADIREAFVVGGDASPPAGGYADAVDLLEALASQPHSLARIGVGGYPEGHPLIPETRLLEALLRKQAHADYIATQICFDPDALGPGSSASGRRGSACPSSSGMPGVVERRKLAEISLKTGVGASLRYLVRHGRPDRDAVPRAALRPDLARRRGRGARRGRRSPHRRRAPLHLQPGRSHGAWVRRAAAA